MSDRLTRALGIVLLIGLILWGGYGVLYYLHVPVHQMVLLADAKREAINAACGMNGVFCRGFAALWPAITHFLAWASPLGGYLSVCLVVAIIAAVGCVLWSSSMQLRWNLSPLHILGLSLLLLWLLFTSLSFINSNSVLTKFQNPPPESQPFHRLYEPTSGVYNVGPQALEALRINFEALKGAGCLRPDGMTVSGAGIYRVSDWCIQGAFFTRVLPHVAFVLCLLLALLSVGKSLLGYLRVRTKNLVVEAAMSAGLGACTYVVILWLLAVLHALTSIAGWIAVVVPVVLTYPSLIAWLRRARDARWQAELPLWHPTPLIVWLLLTLILLNFLNVLRPFPIGWDDLGSYLNRPRLMVSYGHFIPTMSPFQWEYLTSLGFLLFGYDSSFGAVASMMVNWTAGMLALFVVFAFVRAFRESGGVLAALLYYSLPLVGHFSYADMKIDNAIFAMGSLSLLAGFIGVLASDEGKDPSAPRQDLAWLLLAGLFAGFAFGMKPTAVMVIFAIVAVIIGATVHWTAFLAAILAAWGLYARRGALNTGDILSRVGIDTALSDRFLGFLLLIAAILLLLWSFRNHRAQSFTLAKRLAVFIAGAAIAVAPWILRNNILHGNLIPHLEFSAPNLLAPVLDVTGAHELEEGLVVRSLPPPLVVNTESSFCRPTGTKEELDRYWGYRTGLSHYLTLPWRTVMNVDSGGYYVTTMASLLLLPLILLLPALWKRESRWMRWLVAATAFMVAEWMFLANGIPWYGIGMFLGLVIVLEIFITSAPNRATRITAGILIAFGLLTSFSNRMWQFDQQRNLFEYALGKVSAEAMRERTIPHYDDIRDMLAIRRQQMPNRPYVYRVGTFIPYFLPRNPEIIGITDNQLDFFNCLYQERDAALTLQRLQALGFNSVIFDTNTATIEQDSQGSLHQKVNMFVEFLNRSDMGFHVVINDPDGGIAYVLLP